jgi:NAD(P)-dependent dehydrogenase (short-subunit alcohol dehydrogenase family)
MAKIVLITGANKGIGFEVARQLGGAGFTVLLGARDASRGEAAAAKLRAEGSDVRPVVVSTPRNSGVVFVVVVAFLSRRQSEQQSEQF